MKKISIWKVLVLPSLFFILTPLTLFVTLFTLINISAPPKSTSNLPSNQMAAYKDLKSGVRIYASRPESVPSIDVSIEVSDARAEILKNYFLKYNSPLEKFADQIVTEADKEGIDYRLLPAIAQQESNLCKFIPEGSYNCWGWGIHSESNLGFSSYEEGINIVSEGLKEDYIDKGLTTPEEIMTKYTPASNGSWAEGVSQFMKDLE
jgi:hypothetical protein